LDRPLSFETALLSPSEQRAVTRGLRGGDRNAWAALYDSYSEEVWRYAARLVGADEAAVADVVQETFLAAARSAGAFDENRGSLWGWLTGIVHHQAAAYWRAANRAHRVRALAESGAAEIRRLLDESEPLDIAWERRELGDLVRLVLTELTTEYAALLSGKYLDERTLEDLADAWGCSVEAIKSKLARARREFRAKFERFSREPTPTMRETDESRPPEDKPRIARITTDED
jgi:RNA polymerase sigma-70 factor (ECF subfamily)